MKNAVKDCAYIAVGAFILAVGVNVFLVPVKLSAGGVSGIGTVLYYTANVPISFSTLAVNLLLFATGYKVLDKSALWKTILGIAFLSFFLEVTKAFGEYKEDVPIAAVFGGILVGVGTAIAIMRGASTGGSDFAALMFNRLFPHISVPTFILMIDMLVIAVSGIAFRNYTVMLYSAISLYISSKTADFLMIKGDLAKSVFIISRKYHEEIAHTIINDMHRGVTGVYSKGFYNGEDGIMLMCIVKNREIPSLLARVKKIDDSAFTIISEVREVHGEGFKKEIK